MAKVNFTDTGMVRPVDGLGRVVIPCGLREAMGIEPETLLSVFADGAAEEILLKVYHIKCLFCGAGEDLTDFSGRKVCRSCVAALGDMASEVGP